MSVTEYRQKIADRFDTFDRDHDGAVTVRDFDELAESILAEFGLTKNSPKGRALLAGAEHFFQSLCDITDANRDAEISREEFVEGAVTHLHKKPAAFIEMVEPWVNAVVEVADADDDGQVTVKEWERMLRAMRATPERAREKAAQLDTDGDGVITREEVVDSGLRFYTSTEPSRDFAAAR